MQNTRLSTIFDTLNRRVDKFFTNPWRRVSLHLISLLLGFFLGTVITTFTGQKAMLDTTSALVLIFGLELISSWYHRYPKVIKGEIVKRTLLVETLNFSRLGITYSLFIEAFKLGS